MDISFKGKAMIFRKDLQTRDGSTFPRYSTSKGVKQQDGSYKNVWYFVRFRKGVEVPNKTQINITQAWDTYDFWEKNGNEEISHGVFISEFEILEAAAPEGYSRLQDEDIPF